MWVYCYTHKTRLCTEFVDPLTIEPIVASRLIPLDKGNGEVRPIGVGEVIRRIIGKCVTRVAKQDVINASGAMQVCAGQKSGGEAAIHATCNIFEANEMDAALLVDASNAFNSLNRAAALNNIRVWRSLQDLSHKLVTQHSHLGLDVFYENTAGYGEPTAAFTACNLGCAYTIAQRT